MAPPPPAPVVNLTPVAERLDRLEGYARDVHQWVWDARWNASEAARLAADAARAARKEE